MPINLSRPFIARPVATTLLTIGIVLAGIFALVRLPVSPLPQVDFPAISVQAKLPGASPEVVATSVTGPLERHLGQIADLTEMTSISSVGNAHITLLFGLNRNIDGAARDVQAAINAARADLPTSLRQNPSYHKVNPADAPVLVLALTSQLLTLGELYDSAATVLQQSLSQVPGIGEVRVSGSASPAVRVELNPYALSHYGIGLENVRAALIAANAHSPKGDFDDGRHHHSIYTNDQLYKASQYRDLIIAYRNGAPVKLTDVGEAVDSVEDLRNLGLANGKPSVLVILYRQPGANLIKAVDRVKAMLPQLKASLPASIDITPVFDRTTTIRASLKDIEHTLIIAMLLIIGIVLLFLRDWRAALIPSVAVPVSVIGTFAAMGLLGYSLDNLSLMALTIATGFVVDDAIVVLENISRHIEAGMSRLEAVCAGAREVGFTVLSMSVSLVAVFLPILLMGGLTGRLFREFAVTLSVAIGISLLVSLTTTPMMCAQLLRERRSSLPAPRPAGPSRTFAQPRWQGATTKTAHKYGEEEQRRQRGCAKVLFSKLFGCAAHLNRTWLMWLSNGYRHSLSWALRQPALVLTILAAMIALNVYLTIAIPKGFFPQQDTGTLIGGIQADQSISFQLMKAKFEQLMSIVKADPAVASVAGFTGGREINSGFMFITLKPLAERKESAAQIIARLRPKLNDVPGGRLFLQTWQDIRFGGRQSHAPYQYTLLSDSSAELYRWAPIITEALQNEPTLTDVNSDLEQKGSEINLKIDRDTARRLGISMSQIDNTLYDAFGQRQVSTIYHPQNQYHVVMEVAPQYWQDPQMLNDLYISTSGSQANGAPLPHPPVNAITASAANAINQAQQADSSRAAAPVAASGPSSLPSVSPISVAPASMVRLSAFARFAPGNTPLLVNHESQFIATTISFNLPPGKSLSDAVQAINRTVNALGVPTTIHGAFSGSARVFQSSLANQPLLILAALATVYIVLGILYESLLHPLTILSTLPSAGVGALLALLLCRTEFSLIALIGVILLIGIVKKNAIMMIDFALSATRRGLDSREAIFEACLLRFRPIMMTTMAAILSALPLAIGFGEGAELRRPLGISIVGGLIVSQLLTLYTTPVVYLSLERGHAWIRARWLRRYSQAH